MDFYRRLGASRVILDRQITLESMKTLSRGIVDMEFEVFILNTLCVYIDGFCTYPHTYGVDSREYIKHKNLGKGKRIGVLSMYDSESVADACCLKYSIQAYDARFKRVNNLSIKPIFFKHLTDGIECGVCALYYINRTKISSLKIVGRQYGPETRLRSTRFVRSCLDILKKDKDIGRQEYIKMAQQLYRENFKYKNKCKGNNCYYPGALL